MSLNVAIPTPVLCRFNYNTRLVNVTPYTQEEWDSDATNRLMLVRSDDGGTSWLQCANLGYDEGGIFDVGFIYDTTVFRYEDWTREGYWGIKTAQWWAVPVVEAHNPPAAFHYEYSWDGGDTFYPYNPSYPSAYGFYILTSEPSSADVSATIIVRLVNDETDEVECSDTDTLSVTLTKSFYDYPPPGSIDPRPENPDWGETLEDVEWCFGTPPADALVVSLSQLFGCPGDIITVSANAALNLGEIVKDGGNIELTLTNTGTNEYTFPVPAEIAEAGSLTLRFTTSESLDTTEAIVVGFTVSSACFETLCTPPTPDTCFTSTTALRPFTVANADFPVCTATLKFQTKTGAGAWTDLQTGIVADTEYSLGLDIAPNMKARFVSDDDTAGAEIDLLICDCDTTPLPPDELEIPATPAAPVLAKDCAENTVTVTSPAFSTATGAHTTSIEIRRRVSPDGVWTVVHMFASATTWEDTAPEALGSYDYEARACNLAGCSAWSSAATVSLISSTLTLAWQSPPAAASVTGNISLRFSAADSGGVSGLQIYVNGALLGSTPARKSGSNTNGIYTLTLDTRRASQGAATIEVRGVGSDGCKKSVTRALTFANTRALGVLYRDFLTDEAVTGQEIRRLPLSLALGELDTDRSRQYWGQVAVTKEISTPVVTDETDPADAQAAFDSMQPFPMVLQKSWPQLGANPPGSILYGIQTLNVAGAQILIRIRQEQAEQFLAYDTGGATVPKIRQISTGKFLVFAQNPDKVFTFEDDALTVLADIETDEVLTAVTDAALLADKVYFLDTGKLYARDTDGTPARTFQLAIHSEARTPSFIEVCGTKLICLLVGTTGNKTLAVSIATNQISDAWTLEDAATLAWSDGTNLYIACGTKLYISANGTTAPVLVETFAHNITAIAVDGATAAIGLTDGSLQVLRQGVWGETVTAGGAAIDATTIALLDFEFQSALWGKAATATLYGQDGDGSYDVTRALGTYTGVVTQPSGIASLARYFVEGEDDAPDDERVLVGTTGGVLLALSVARQSSASAWLHSSISDIESGAVARLIPVEE